MVWINTCFLTECGVKYLGDNTPTEPILTHIKDSETTTKHEYPWLVLIQNEATGNFTSGSIINSKYIITGSHVLETP